ncbi:MAG: EamA family transporter [Acidobacteria bacterium]|nr:EamA family transporter [Acidobacteriota bacterium]
MRSRTGYAELVACGLVWGSVGVFVKKASASAPTIVFFRLLIGFAAIIAWFAVRRRLSALRTGPRPALLVSAGLLLAAHWAMFFEAYKRLDVAPTILIVYLGPVLVALGAPLVLGEPLERRTFVSLALSVAGIALIAVPQADRLDRAGLALAVGAGLSFAALVLVAKKLTGIYDPQAVLAWQTGVATIALSPALLSARASEIAASAPWLVTLGLVHTGAAGILYFRGLSAVKAQHVSILVYLEPATAVLYAWAFLRETPTPLTLLGGALILAAGLLVVLARPEVGAPAGLPEPRDPRPAREALP